MGRRTKVATGSQPVEANEPPGGRLSAHSREAGTRRKTRHRAEQWRKHPSHRDVPRGRIRAPQLSPRSKNRRNPAVFCKILQFVLIESRFRAMQRTEIKRLIFLGGPQSHSPEKFWFKRRNGLKHAVLEQIRPEKGRKTAIFRTVGTNTLFVPAAARRLADDAFSNVT